MDGAIASGKENQTRKKDRRGGIIVSGVFNDQQLMMKSYRKQVPSWATTKANKNNNKRRRRK